MTAKLVIFGTLPNLNDYTKANRTITNNRNFNFGAKMKRDTEEMISLYIMQQLRGVHFKNPVNLSFEWYEPNKKRDKDNVCFAKKFILDALVKNKVIDNDGWKNIIGFQDDFYVSANNPRIEVSIRD